MESASAWRSESLLDRPEPRRTDTRRCRGLLSNDHRLGRVAGRRGRSGLDESLGAGNIAEWSRTTPNGDT